MEKTLQKILERLAAIEQHLQDVDSRIGELSSRVNIQNGRLLKLKAEGAVLSGKVAVLIVVVCTIMSTAASLLIRLLTP